MSEQGFDLANVYTVADRGAMYDSVAGALNAIVGDKPGEALIMVAAGSFDAGTVINFPSGLENTKVTVQGIGSSILKAELDLSNVGYLSVPIGHYVGESSACLTFRNIQLLGELIYGTKTSGNGMVVFHECYIRSAEAVSPYIHFDGGATGNWYLNLHNCFIVNEGSTNVLRISNDITLFLEDTKLSLRGDVAGTALYINAPNGRRLIKNCAIEVKGVVGGQTINASAGATAVTIVNSSYNKAPAGNIAITAGTVNTNTVIAGDYICG